MIPQKLNNSFIDLLHMVENAGIKINLKINKTSIRDNKGISQFLSGKIGVNTEKQVFVCDIVFLFVKHSAF